MKIVKFSRPPSSVHLRPKFFHALDFGCPISNEPPSPNDNQSIKGKHDAKMTNTYFQQSNLRITLYEKCPNTGEYGPEKTPYLDTFHAVLFIIFSDYY